MQYCRQYCHFVLMFFIIIQFILKERPNDPACGILLHVGNSSIYQNQITENTHHNKYCDTHISSLSPELQDQSKSPFLNCYFVVRYFTKHNLGYRAKGQVYTLNWSISTAIVQQWNILSIFSLNQCHKAAVRQRMPNESQIEGVPLVLFNVYYSLLKWPPVSR